MKRINKATVERELRHLGDEQPGTVNASTFDSYGDEVCVYTDSGGRHCIAGQVAVNLGLDISQVPEATFVSAAFRAAGLPFTDGALSLLTSAQALADGYMSWGDVVEYLRRQDLL